MQRITKILIPLLIVSITLPGCSSFSKQTRAERAHRKYVRKIRHEQAKQVAKTTKEANRPLHERPYVSAPQVTVGVESGNSGIYSDPGQ